MSTPSPRTSADYLFRLDGPIAPRIFSDTLEISGWLLHREGEPITGIRAVVTRSFSREKTVKGRRKRSRPDVEVAFPDLPEAKSSGFLLQIPLSLGKHRLQLQVRDESRTWRTFHRLEVRALSLTVLRRIGFPRVQRFLLTALTRSYGGKPLTTKRAPLLPRTTAVPEVPRQLRRIELFATSRSNLFILEIAQLIAAGFRDLGLGAELHLDEPPTKTPPQDTLQIVVTPHEYYNLYLTEHVSRKEACELTRETILLSTEQPETGWFQSNLQWAPFARGMADINPLGVLACAARGVRCHQLALGFHPILRSSAARAHVDRTTEVTFLGSLTERREEFFAAQADFFAAHRCHLRFVPLHFAKTAVTRSYLSASSRNDLLGDTRILLNVHYSEQRYFEWHRALVALANGCCVITETCEGYGVLQPGRHFIMVALEDLIPCCDYYLAHPEECERIAQEGYEFLSTHLRQEEMCAAFLRELGEASGLLAGNVAADAQPIPLPQKLIRRLRSHRARLLHCALKKDLAAMTAGVRDSFRGEKKPPSAEAIAEPRHAIVRQREGFRERLEAQMQAGDGGALSLHDNNAYTQCTQPALTIVVTLYNYAQFIDECLGSIQGAARQLRQPIEVVIVNDASTDCSLAVALRYQQQCALPVRVVDKNFNTGLADARNTGIRLARAPFVFILDADNLVFPQAFVQMLSAIEEEDSVAAFSLLCRFRGTPANRVGLLSYYDWDPQILVQYPYIDAMAMFRRDALLASGGYDSELSQVGWFGWEDYDLWLRFAHHRQKVAFVPNILCLYRHHETSMIKTTNLFEAELVQHFIGRYGELLARFEPRATIFGVDRERVAR